MHNNCLGSWTVFLSLFRSVQEATTYLSFVFLTVRYGADRAPKTWAPGPFPSPAPLSGHGWGAFFSIPCRFPRSGPCPTHTPDGSPLKIGGTKRGPVQGMSAGGPLMGSVCGLCENIPAPPPCECWVWRVKTRPAPPRNKHWFSCKSRLLARRTFPHLTASSQLFCLLVSPWWRPMSICLVVPPTWGSQSPRVEMTTSPAPSPPRNLFSGPAFPPSG